MLKLLEGLQEEGGQGDAEQAHFQYVAAVPRIGKSRPCGCIGHLLGAPVSVFCMPISHDVELDRVFWKAQIVAIICSK